ncbi:ArfGap-domain-containing protein [Basidiobolus meristosporus CBS 931.73]|uniref:ArfGap-domain-containing protein n=1 Tax=Basidiobolus meristosporus CBS 931.73 TaxID=1314790 RepID=A0A1Y1Z4J5_9FUNG|nr:ArfGap-domain-containing protein [Basidiobolus meristosporus CBS 931.73]|eukprot:ORY04907.1 ArfGap-domain-containing protein [Basidiobolus meristosporus CBS 931.73]
MMEWIQCLHNAIDYSFNSVHFTTSTPSTRSKDSDIADEQSNHSQQSNPLMEKIRQIPGNQKCADCRAPDPQWASINLGAVLCIECSGIHRSLGVHCSKVRSLNLDNWEPEVIEMMLKLGNDKVNCIFEAGVANNDDSNLVPITYKSPRIDREKWIIAKYSTKRFVWSKTPEGFLVDSALDSALWNAVSEGDLFEALKCLALGANVDWKNDMKNGTAPIHISVVKDDLVALEFLLQSSCNIDTVDGQGKTALHYAAELNNIKMVVYLLKRGAKYAEKDCHDQTPLDIALAKAHVDIVTALRYEQSFGNSLPPHHSWHGLENGRSSLSRQRHPYSTSDLASLDSRRSSVNSGICYEPISPLRNMSQPSKEYPDN